MKYKATLIHHCTRLNTLLDYKCPGTSIHYLNGLVFSKSDKL